MSASKISLLLLAILIAAVVLTKPDGAGILETAQTDGVTFVSDDDPAMLAAFSKAQSSLDRFLQLAASPPPDTSSFSVKVAISEGDRKEYFWITPFTTIHGSFSGQINNTPQVVSNVKEGQEIRFERSDIVDWTYQNGEGTRYGNFTACAILTRESSEEAAAFKAHYGLACDP